MRRREFLGEAALAAGFAVPAFAAAGGKECAFEAPVVFFALM